MTKEEFRSLTQQPVLLDGAFGTNMYAAGMPKGVSTEGWALEHADVVRELQRGYVEAGTRILYAPTFGLNRHVLQGFGMEERMREMNRRLVALTREAAGDEVLVAGDLAPTGMLLESSGGENTVEELFEVYREQIEYLAEAGVDLLVAETMMSVDDCVVAVDAAHAVCDLPVMCSLTVNADGRAYYGGTITEAAETLQEMGADAVGINCCSGPDQVLSIIEQIAKISRIPIIAKPNAGMPRIDDSGRAIYDMGPDEFAHKMMALVDAGAVLVGGCCGTTPAYIRRLDLALKGQLITAGHSLSR